MQTFLFQGFYHQEIDRSFEINQVEIPKKRIKPNIWLLSSFCYFSCNYFALLIVVVKLLDAYFTCHIQLSSRRLCDFVFLPATSADCID